MTHVPSPELLTLIHPYTGDLADIRAEPAIMSDLTAVVECTKGPFFVKAMRNQPNGRRDSIIRERVISPFVQSVSPALLWAAEDEEWIALGFEVVDGRHPDFEPDSPDLAAVVQLLNRVGELHLPKVAQEWHETRWDQYTANAAEAELFRGDAFLHADISPYNIIIGDRDTWAIDWGWPTRGAAFIDPAMLVVQLVSSGHSPKSAESWAARCTAWAHADPKAIDAFAAAQTRMWWRLAFQRPDRRSRRFLAEAAEAWANYRGIVVL